MGHVIGIDTTYTGNPVSFNAVNGGTMKSVSVPFSATQDLHGYANPWPAGGGKNNFYYPTNFNSTGSYGLVYKYDKDTETFSITGTNTKTSAYIALFLKASDGTATPSMTVGQTCYVYHNLPTGTYMNLTYLDGNGVTKAFSIIGGGAGTGDYVQRSFIVPNDYASFSQLQIGIYGSATQINKTDIHIALGTDSAFTEWTPYSNICPISGRTGLSVYRTGKNLCSVNELPANPTYYWGSNYSIIVNILNTLPTGTYTMYVTQEVVTMPSNGKVTHGRPYLTALQNGTQTPVLSYSVASDDSPYVGKTYRDGGTFTITEEIKGNFNNAYFYCDQRDTHSGNGRGTYNVKEIQIELGSPATTYEPYNGNTYAVDWTTQAGTVYGGTLDVVSGELTVDMVNIPSYNGETINEPWLSSMDAYAEGTTPTIGAQVVYTLATPLTYQLTPKSIAALIGQNYIWSSNNETLTAVLTAPATGFAGWLIKCVTNGTPVEIPLKYMRAETYTVTPDQRMEWSAERDVTGVLHRETVQNLPPKIEFNTPLMTNSDINALNSIIKAAFTSYLQRNITIQFYDPERDQYWEWDCYMPDVKYHIRNAGTVNNIINYEELRYAFIGY